MTNFETSIGQHLSIELKAMLIDIRSEVTFPISSRDFQEEYTQVCKNFVSSNNLVSSRSHQENLDVIHRSILYNKIQTHKQQV